jgi:hypothetical protein
MSYTSRRLFHGIMAAVVLVISNQSATADTIQIPITAFADTATIVEFGVASSAPLPYSEDGANFLSYSGFSSSVIGGNAFLSLAGPGTLTVIFDQPVNMAGFNFSNSFSPAGVRAAVFSDLAGLQPVGQVIFPGFAPLQSGFVGWAADAPFALAEITFAVPSQFASFVIDDFRFDTGAPIPEPGTMMLALTGLGLLARHIARQARPR